MSYDTEYRIALIDGPMYISSCEHSPGVMYKFCPECGFKAEPVDACERLRQIIKTGRDGYDPLNGEPTSWYQHEVDILAALDTVDVTSLVIALYGNGEESDDLWVKYFTKGKCYKEMAEVFYPKFNASLLEKKEYPKAGRPKRAVKR